MVGWHHKLDGHEFEQALGVGDWQRSLACCSPWGRKESDMTEHLNWTELVSSLNVSWVGSTRCSTMEYLLLFSCWVVSDSFMTAETVTHQSPLSWDFLGKNTGVGCHFLLQGSFPTQGLNPSLLHWQAGFLPLSCQRSPQWSIQFSTVQSLSRPTLCDPMNRSTPGIPVHHQLPEFTQTHAHRVGDAIQPSHALSSPSSPAPNPSQHQSIFQWVNSWYEVAKVLEFQLQHQLFQWTPRTNLF